jgi:hypothetical protein
VNGHSINQLFKNSSYTSMNNQSLNTDFKLWLTPCLYLDNSSSVNDVNGFYLRFWSDTIRFECLSDNDGFNLIIFYSLIDDIHFYSMFLLFFAFVKGIFPLENANSSKKVKISFFLLSYEYVSSSIYRTESS